MPSLGVWRSTARLRRLIAALVDAARGASDYPSETVMKRIVGHRRVQRELPQPDAGGGGERDASDTWAFVQLPGGRNRLELLAGMVKSNRPLGLVTALSTAFSLAAAAGAFGIFYGSIWTLADSLHPARQLLVSVAVVALLSTWLIVRNGLWSWGRETTVRWQRRLDNSATVIREATYSRRVYERRQLADSFDERGATE